LCEGEARLTWEIGGHGVSKLQHLGPVPGQNPIRVASMADGGGVGHAPIALNCLRSLPTWGIVT
jgi:hypothetical protein